MPKNVMVINGYQLSEDEAEVVHTALVAYRSSLFKVVNAYGKKNPHLDESLVENLEDAERVLKQVRD